MTQLSVNVNKVATLRNARGKNMPDLTEVTKDLIFFGAQGITIHPRPDGRHVRTEDVYSLSHLIQSMNEGQEVDKHLELNIEGYPSAEFLSMILEVRPHQCTLVPDPPDVITSNAGWDVLGQAQLLQEVLGQLKGAGVRSSLFMAPDDIGQRQLESLENLKPDRVELYTEAYADAFGTDKQGSVTSTYKQAAEQILKLGIELNAGHDLNLENLPFLIRNIPAIREVSIGHALICESLYMGFEKTIQSYLQRLRIETL